MYVTRIILIILLYICLLVATMFMVNKAYHSKLNEGVKVRLSTVASENLTNNKP